MLWVWKNTHEKTPKDRRRVNEYTERDKNMGTDRGFSAYVEVLLVVHFYVCLYVCVLTKFQ